MRTRVTGALFVTRHDKWTWYENGSVRLSVHATGNCLIDYGQELRLIDRQGAAAVLRSLRAGEHVRYGLGIGQSYCWM
jgi:hypothetical protein